MAVRVVVCLVAFAMAGVGSAAARPSAMRVPEAAQRPAGVTLASWSDFNGDGYDDLPIGVPGEDVGSVRDAGVVHVFYGSFDGLAVSAAQSADFTPPQIWHQNIPARSGDVAVPGVAEEGDRFGWAVTVGNFDGDAYGDLAIGVPGEDTPLKEGVAIDGGSIQVLLGSADGLRAAGGRSMTWSGSNAQFGSALVALETGADPTKTELAIGLPGEADGAGRVFVLGAGHLTAGSDEHFFFAMSGSYGPGAGYGTVLAAGDLDPDPVDDLVVSAPRADGAGDLLIESSGVVEVIRNLESFSVFGSGGDDTAEVGDRFGTALAVGELTGDDLDDLVVGAPLDDVMGIVDAGTVALLWGGPNGPLPSGSIALHQGSPSVPGSVGRGNRFGASVAVHHFGVPPVAEGPQPVDDTADVAVGVPGTDVGGDDRAGAVAVLYFQDGTRSLSGDQLWTQDTAGVLDAAEAGDGFGTRLLAGRFGRSFAADLTIGAPDEDVGAVRNAGAVSVLYAGTGPRVLTATGDQWWHQDREGVAEVIAPGDGFGSGVQVGGG